MVLNGIRKFVRIARKWSFTSYNHHQFRIRKYWLIFALIFRFNIDRSGGFDKIFEFCYICCILYRIMSSFLILSYLWNCFCIWNTLGKRMLYKIRTIILKIVWRLDNNWFLVIIIIMKQCISNIISMIIVIYRLSMKCRIIIVTLILLMYI